MRAIRIFIRNVGSALKSITRNFSLSVASVTCTTITLLIVALAIIISVNINSFTKDLEDTLSIYVFVDSKATEDEIDQVKNKIVEIKNIKSDEIVFKDKEKLKEETMSKTDKNDPLYSIMDSWNKENNPLKNEYIVSVKDLTQIDDTVETLKKINNVTNVQYSEDVIDRMVTVFDIVEKVTGTIIIGLIVVTIFLICNTIKLTIFARKSEIEIMRLVGTSNFVIKLPFVIEGLFLGIIGSIIPVVATIWGYIIAYDKLDKHLFTNFIRMIDPMPFTIHVALVLIAIGSVVGMIGSYATVRRYLKI